MNEDRRQDDRFMDEAFALAEQGRGATPHEIEAILQREKERLARVKAH